MGNCCFPQKIQERSVNVSLGMPFIRNEVLPPTRASYSFEANQLAMAVSKGDFDEVQTLLLECTTISINEKDEKSCTPLYRASEKGQHKIAKLLLELGAFPNIENSFGYTPLHASAKLGDVAMCELLISYGADVNLKTPSNLSPLHLAILENHYSAVECLIRRGANLKMRDSGTKETPMLLACSLGNLKIVRLLDSSGASLYDVDEDGNTCLHLACENGHAEALEYLISRISSSTQDNLHGNNHVNGNNNVNSANNGKIGIATRNKVRNRTALHCAAISGHVGCCRELLLAGADVNVEDSVRRTPLHYASSKGYANVVELLLQNGASSTRRDDSSLYSQQSLEGKTPFELSSDSLNYHKVSKIFREYEKKSKKVIMTSNNNNNNNNNSSSPLMMPTAAVSHDGDDGVVSTPPDNKIAYGMKNNVRSTASATSISNVIL